ncbi:Inositol monophosphatase 2 [Sphaceloma murrayae]|uniref:Inositol-1-monophosphatase n=1 Tax=Sphaceloma murrayae TaxID=2082308 RepID=A0A2K1QGV3_9PEZI|nr:Inositol monophosphatase 2 [Sphaceloma murrayae]
MSTKLSEAELTGIYDFAIQLGKDAGKMLLDGQLARMQGGLTLASVEKDSSVDIVTKTDTDVEAFIHASITKAFPSHAFIGEESYSAGSTKDYLLTASPTWIVDPLDGTVNYTHLFPSYCVSIAFCIAHRPVIGVIYAPFLSQLFTACQGRGAWLSTPAMGSEPVRLPLARNPIAPLPPAAPKGCVFGCEWGKDRRDRPEGNLRRKVETFVNMAAEIGGREGKGGMVHGVRSLGSATLDLAYVALGGVDIWWEGGCWEWDVAAGVCILEEAGGLVTTARPPENPEMAEVVDAKLGSRLYLAIRGAGDTEKETGRQQQERVVREVWKRVHTLDYNRPGL